jgi:glycyl-tRNA synthetase (class II)
LRCRDSMRQTRVSVEELKHRPLARAAFQREFDERPFASNVKLD